MYLVKVMHIDKDFKTGYIFEYIDKINMPSLKDLEAADDTPISYNTSCTRVHELKTSYGEGSFKVAIDLEDNQDEIINFVNTIYDKAIGDVANALGMTTTAVRSMIMEYSARKLERERQFWS